MPRLSITHVSGQPFRVGAELDWEFSSNGFDGADAGWEVSTNGADWLHTSLGNGSIIVPEGVEGAYLRAFLFTRELDRNGTPILCRYYSPAYGPIGTAL